MAPVSGKNVFGLKKYLGKKLLKRAISRRSREYPRLTREPSFSESFPTGRETQVQTQAVASEFSFPATHAAADDYIIDFPPSPGGQDSFSTSSSHSKDHIIELGTAHSKDHVIELATAHEKKDIRVLKKGLYSLVSSLDQLPPTLVVNKIVHVEWVKLDQVILTYPTEPAVRNYLEKAEHERGGLPKFDRSISVETSLANSIIHSRVGDPEIKEGRGSYAFWLRNEAASSSGGNRSGDKEYATVAYVDSEIANLRVWVEKKLNDLKI